MMTSDELLGKMTIFFTKAVNEQIRGGRKSCTMRFKLNAEGKTMFCDAIDMTQPEPINRENVKDANFRGVPIDFVDGPEVVEFEMLPVKAEG